MSQFSKNGPGFDPAAIKNEFEFGPKIREKYGKTCDRVYVWQGDITSLKADAIVNAANEQLLPGGGVCGAIHNKAGPELAKECKQIGHCRTGEAVITAGYNLPAKHVIHAVGPMGEKPELLRSVYKSILSLSKEKQLSSVAVPCISTGIYGYPADRAAEIATETVLQNLPDNVERFIFCTFLNSDYDLYKKLLSQ
jgi:O-acetyl-ADP-ribose deacetylase (regulator of RNase III)